MRAETRHQLKQDRFRGATLQVAERTAHWSVEHKSTIVVGALVLAVVAAIVLGGWYYMNQQDQKASVELSKAERTLDTPVRPSGMPAQPDVASFGTSKERGAEALKQFQAIVQNYPHTRSADIARYMAGITATELGDFAAAKTDLEATANLGNQDLASLGRFALASVYRKQGQNKDAIAIYRKLMEKPTTTVSKAMAQLELGDALLADQQPLEAKLVYEQVQKENPATPASQIAQQKLQDLK